MDLKTMALAMYPYWIMGLVTLLCVWKAGYKDVIRVETDGVKKFLRFMFFVTIYRAIIFHFFASRFEETAHAITAIPWQLTLTVFWEDACHGLPLFMFTLLFADKKWMKPVFYVLLAAVMFEFGLGHVYQGVIAAIFLSFYIPYSIKMGREHGFGTVMLCHTIYDLTTILSLKLLLGV